MQAEKAQLSAAHHIYKWAGTSVQVKSLTVFSTGSLVCWYFSHIYSWSDSWGSAMTTLGSLGKPWGETQKMKVLYVYSSQMNPEVESHFFRQ